MFPFLLALAFGFFGSIPVAGPISAVVLERALAGRGSSGFLVALGGALAEAAWAFLAAWGMGDLVTRYPALLTTSQKIGGLLLFVLGAVFAFRPPTFAAGKQPSRLYQIGAFAFGFVITAINPTLLVTWTAAATALYASGIAPDALQQPLPFALGALVGIVAWFALLLALVRRYHARMSRGVIEKIVRATGVVLMLLGLWVSVRAFA